MRILFIVTFLANIVFAFGSLPWLPNQVAVHFDANGTPNGFISPVVSAVVMSVTAGFITAIMFGISGLTTMTVIHMPEFVNIPNRDYWLTEENRQKTLRRLRWLTDSIGFLTMLHILFIQWEIFRFNRAVPPKVFNSDMVMYVSIVYLVLLTVVFVRFHMWFRLPKNGEQ